MRLLGDLGGSDFWRVRCSKIQIVWGWLLLLFRPRGRLADIYDDATAPNAIPLMLDLLVIVYFVPYAFGQNSENQTIKHKKVLGRQIKAESSFAMIYWCYLMVIKQLLEGGHNLVHRIKNAKITATCEHRSPKNKKVWTTASCEHRSSDNGRMEQLGNKEDRHNLEDLVIMVSCLFWGQTHCFVPLQVFLIFLLLI